MLAVSNLNEFGTYMHKPHICKLSILPKLNIIEKINKSDVAQSQDQPRKQGKTEAGAQG